MKSAFSFLNSKLLWIAALGYFVDLYDLVLFGVVRVQSLRSLGLNDSEVFSIGSRLLNLQMAGMLVGGLLWGILGDKKGRRAALYGSIFVYSLANFLNAFVQNVQQYEFLRFISGFGLAGELGAAITMTSEALGRRERGLAAAFVASVGFLGAVSATVVSQFLDWRSLYLSGGILGFVLLALRLKVQETGIFESAKQKVSTGARGSLKILFGSGDRGFRLFLAVLVGVPIWFVAGILAYFTPELGRALNIQGEVQAGPAIMVGYLGSILGDIACGFLSHVLRSRRRAVLWFLVFGGVTALGHPLWVQGGTPWEFYFSRGLIGFANGYVAVLVAWVAELYGTNLRATVTTWAPNLIRASLIPLLMAWNGLTGIGVEVVAACTFVGLVAFALALVAAYFSKETFDRDLDFLER